MKQNKIDTVIFDLDGTLLDTIDDLRNAVNYVLAKYSMEERSLSEIKRFVGNGIKRLLELSISVPVKDAVFEEMFMVFKEYYTDHCNLKTRPYPQILELLECLRTKGIKLAIVSNKNDQAVKNLNQIYFKDYIQTAIGEKEGIRKKPAPDTVLAALSELGSQMEQSLYIGDSEVDKMTADNIPMECILVEWGFRSPEELSKLHPYGIIQTPMQLLNFID